MLRPQHAKRSLGLCQRSSGLISCVRKPISSTNLSCNSCRKTQILRKPQNYQNQQNRWLSSAKVDTGYSEEFMKQKAEEYNAKRDAYKLELDALRKTFREEHKAKKAEKERKRQEEEEKLQVKHLPEIPEAAAGTVRYPTIGGFGPHGLQPSRELRKLRKGPKEKRPILRQFPPVVLPQLELIDKPLYDHEAKLERYRKKKELRLQKRVELEAKLLQQDKLNQEEILNLRRRLTEESVGWFTKKDLEDKSELTRRIEERLNVLAPLSAAFH